MLYNNTSDRSKACSPVSQFPANVEYAERGQGPALLFVPGSFGTGAGWKPVMEKLGEGYRFVTTSLLGYGLTAERRPLGNRTTIQQTEILDAVFERIAAPVHVIAHSYGGLSVLARALYGKHKAESITLVEANPLAILQTSGEEALFTTFGVMTISVAIDPERKLVLIHSRRYCANPTSAFEKSFRSRVCQHNNRTFRSPK
jgi:pimeloyl-ACP methyl ester carboxylesterase